MSSIILYFVLSLNVFYFYFFCLCVLSLSVLCVCVCVFSILSVILSLCSQVVNQLVIVSIMSLVNVFSKCYHQCHKCLKFVELSMLFLMSSVFLQFVCISCFVYVWYASLFFMFPIWNLCVCQIDGQMEDGMERFTRLALDLKPPNMTNKNLHILIHIFYKILRLTNSWIVIFFCFNGNYDNNLFKNLICTLLSKLVIVLLLDWKERTFALYI